MTLKAEGIRQHFRDWVRSKLGQEVPVSMRETTLLCAGSFVGRKFSMAGYHLVWLVASDQLKFYQSDGLLVECTRDPASNDAVASATQEDGFAQGFESPTDRDSEIKLATDNLQFGHDQ